MDQSLMTPVVSAGKPRLSGNPHCKSWPAEHLAALKQLVADGLTSNKIAALPMFKGSYSRSAIVAMAGRIGLVWKGSTGPKLPAERQEAALKPKPAEPQKAAQKTPAIVVAPKMVRHPNVFEIRDSQCHWPLWEGPEHITDKRYCGAPAAGSPCLCEKHHALSYSRGRS